MPEIISIVSGKGGAGKTFAAANLSLAFQSLGEQAVCIDTDINSPNLAIQLGHVPENYTFEDVLDEKVNPMKAISIHDSGLMFIPASLHLSEHEAERGRLADLIRNFSDFADRIIIDSPPGFGNTFSTSLDLSDRILVVTNPEVQAIQDAKKIVDEAERRGTPVEGLILNKSEEMLEELTPEEVESHIGSRVLMKIPYRKEVRKSVYTSSPVAMDKHSKIGSKFKWLAADLSGKEFKPPIHSPIVRFFRKLM